MQTSESKVIACAKALKQRLVWLVQGTEEGLAVPQ